MNTVPRKRIHPQMFALYIAMASIAMMFAGLTSAYIVRKAQPRWRVYDIPHIFWFSTAVIVISSITVAFALRSLKAQQIAKARTLTLLTFLLGVTFCVLQLIGRSQLYHLPDPIRVDGNPSESFLFIIWGLHLAHIIGGLVALLFVFIRSFWKKDGVYNSTGLAIAANYWHFVDVLWIYLFFFFVMNQ